MSINELKNSFEDALSQVEKGARIDPNRVAITNKKLQELVERTKKLGEPAEIKAADLYDIAFRFLNSEQLAAYEFSCLGAAINIPIKEKDNERIASTEMLSLLLSLYTQQMNSGDLMIGTWWRVFQAYFNITIADSESIPPENKKQLSQFLIRYF